MPNRSSFQRGRLAWRAGALWVAIGASATALRGQCPGGTPPPCAAPRVAARAAAPPIDDRTWIVVPFDNASHGAETEWLRDASVNLLYLDLSRWQDIHVVDDKRVADFMREVPGASAAQRLSLNDGLAVAKRAGAGRLVMGDVLKVGSRTMVTATVFDVRRGARVRSAREETAVQDSLMALFGKLARGILAVAPPAGANVGVIGTSSVDAYQEYLAGTQALNRFEVVAAKRHLARALELDTGFALAHYKLAVASVYDESNAAMRVAHMNVSDTLAMMKIIMSFQALDAASVARVVDDPERLAHATAAARLSVDLPVRERALITGLLAHAKKDYARACAIYDGLVRADSSDVEALYGLGECLFQDEAVENVGGDTTQVRFRSSWNSALRVMRRIVRVDPSFHLTFDEVVSILTAPNRIGCRRTEPAAPCNPVVGPGRYRAVVRPDGDSLLVVPVPSESRALLRDQAEGERTRARVRNLEEARAEAEAWVAAAPREMRAHRALSWVLLRQGRLDEADAELLEATKEPELQRVSDPELAYMRLNLLLKRSRSREFTRLVDSVGLEWRGGLARGAISAFSAMTGRLGWYTAFADTLLGGALKLPPLMVRQGKEAAPITLGVGGDSAAAAEGQLVAGFFPGPCGSFCAAALRAGIRFGLRLPRARWPALDSTGPCLCEAPARALARGDTAGLRVAARALDSASRAVARVGATEDGTSAIAADALLLLGDSLAALNAVRRMMDTTLVVTPFETILPGGGLQVAGFLWPRGMLLRAELAAALGEKEEARVWYGRFVELWVGADPQFQPIVERARAALQRLGGSR